MEFTKTVAICKEKEKVSRWGTQKMEELSLTTPLQILKECTCDVHKHTCQLQSLMMPNYTWHTYISDNIYFLINLKCNSENPRVPSTKCRLNLSESSTIMISSIISFLLSSIYMLPTAITPKKYNLKIQ